MTKNLTQLMAEKEAEFDKIKRKYAFGSGRHIELESELKKFLRSSMIETALTMQRETEVKKRENISDRRTHKDHMDVGFNDCLTEKSRLEKEFIGGERA